MDMAFLSMANSNYSNALSVLQQALEAMPGNATVINNLAVCYLYLGKYLQLDLTFLNTRQLLMQSNSYAFFGTGSLKEGLTFLESQLTANPALLLQETPVLNLCTLYELESSYAGQKKRALLDLVSQYKGDAINTACLKLQ